MQVTVATLEAAFVSTLRTVPLEKCSILICGYEHGKSLDDPDTRWALTEWYLKEAGYEQIGEHRWKKDRGTNVPSSGNSGLNLKREGGVLSSRPSAGNPTSQTDSTERSTPVMLRPLQTSKKRISSKLNRGRLSNGAKKVVLERTPEEWALVLAEARLHRESDLTKKGGDGA